MHDVCITESPYARHVHTQRTWLARSETLGAVHACSYYARRTVSPPAQTTCMHVQNKGQNCRCESFMNSWKSLDADEAMREERGSSTAAAELGLKIHPPNTSFGRCPTTTVCDMQILQSLGDFFRLCTPTMPPPPCECNVTQQDAWGGGARSACNTDTCDTKRTVGRDILFKQKLNRPPQTTVENSEFVVEGVVSHVCQIPRSHRCYVTLRIHEHVAK